MSETTRVTRFEVIDETGRVLVRHGVILELSFQDEGRTLKVFLRERSAGSTPSVHDTGEETR
jgi:hypothetical protein